MAYVPGTARSESLYGTSDADQIRGVGGHDTIWGYSGADVLRGGAGNDVLYSYYSYSSDSDADVLYGEGGNDYLTIGGGDSAYGGTGRDTIEASGGTSAPAVIAGNGGYDTLIINSGDSIVGARISGIERLEGSSVYYSGGLAASQFSLFATVGAVSGYDTASFRIGQGGSGRIRFDDKLEEANIYGGDEAVTLRVISTGATSLHYSGSTGRSTIIAGSGNDSIEGGSGADNLWGSAGNDTISAYSSGYYSDDERDTLRGGDGNDSLYAGEGDVAFGDTGRDTIVVRGSAPHTIDGGTGVDTLYVSSGNISTSFIGDMERLLTYGTVRMDADQFSQFDRIQTDGSSTYIRIWLEQGGVGNLRFDRSVETVAIDGTDSADETLRMIGPATPDVTYSGGSGRTLFEAGGGNDSLQGGSGADTLSGGAGDDVVRNYSYVYDDDVQDRLSGGDGNDSIWGGTDDIIDGGRGNDWIYIDGPARVTAGEGHDVIIASTSDDRIDAGAGSDTVSYEEAREALTVNLNRTAQDTGGGGLDTLIGVEHVVGGQYDDAITGTAGANILEGGYGDDSLYAGAGRDTASYASTTGDITVDLRVTTAQDTSGAGIDLLSGFENLTGGSGDDTLLGDARSNVLIGGNGNDILNGRLGFDIVSYETAEERVQVSLAIRAQQPVGGETGTDRLVSIEGLRGSLFDDGIEGDNGANLLAGLAGNDVLVGSGGADTLNGGAGLDRLRGGTDADVFDFDRATDSTWEQRDIILDFSSAAGDRIDLSGIDARPLAGEQDFTFGSARVGGITLRESGTDTLVLGNTDYDRDFEVALLIRDGATRASSYTADDFIL